MVVWNHGNRPIFIAHEIIPHPSGLSAGMGESKIIIEPNQGIDLDVLNLRTERPSDLSMLEHDLRAAQSLNVPFIDAMTIKYECPRCGHPQKQYFKFKKVGDEIEFACQDCGFKNAAKLTDSEGEDDGKK